MEKEIKKLISEIQTYINMIQVNLDEVDRMGKLENSKHIKTEKKTSIFSDEQKAKIRADRRKRKMLTN
ncbi:hypothetical protein [Gelidibacter sp.]|uniref:hypothetical protein n=1 Tax=Gelidibacter sp. TaxID=2018083 RepID=UPI0032668B05